MERLSVQKQAAFEEGGRTGLDMRQQAVRFMPDRRRRI